jgi:hypothetical protein
MYLRLGNPPYNAVSVVVSNELSKIRSKKFSKIDVVVDLTAPPSRK